MPGRFLLDSSVLIRIIRGDALLRERLADLPQVYIVPTIIGELYYGAHKSDTFATEEAAITKLLQAIIALPYDYQTGVEYARIKDALRRKGRPIPEPDIWIAAAAMQYNLTLVHRDQHFEEVSGLSQQKW